LRGTECEVEALDSLDSSCLGGTTSWFGAAGEGEATAAVDDEAEVDLSSDAIELAFLDGRVADRLLVLSPEDGFGLGRFRGLIMRISVYRCSIC
jgi:hypothetical protein